MRVPDPVVRFVPPRRHGIQPLRSSDRENSFSSPVMSFEAARIGAFNWWAPK